MRWANWGDSFWYADALGAKAAHGYSGFARQDFIGIDYGLLDCPTVGLLVCPVPFTVLIVL